MGISISVWTLGIKHISVGVISFFLSLSKRKTLASGMVFWNLGLLFWFLGLFLIVFLEN